MSSARPSTHVLSAVALVAAVMFVNAGSRPALADDFVPVALSGMVFEDCNGDGMFDSHSELPLAGLETYMGDGDQVLQTTFTDAQGNYSFSGVGPGMYYVDVIPAVRSVQTKAPNAIFTSSGADVGGLDFGYFRVGTLSGHVLEDLTGDGFSADDKPFGVPVPVDLFFDGGSSPFLTATSDSGGYYSFPSFPGLGPGVYTVRERVPSGYVLTAQVGATIQAFSGFQSVGNDFDNFPLFGVSMLAVYPVEGAPFAGPIARVTPGDATSVAGYFTATIDWGDGAASAGTLANDPNGGFFVSGGHTYAEEGAYTLAVSVTRISGATTGGSQAVTVRDAALHALGQSLPSSPSANFSGVVATFTDDDPNGVIADYSARIDWGDGTSSMGTVSPDQRSFTVGCSHSFTQGRFTITTTIIDKGGASASATSTITIDWTPPTTTASVNGNLLTLAAVDNLTGVHATYYTLNGGPALTYISPVALTSGKNTIQYWSVDVVGNSEVARSIQVAVRGK